MLDAESTLDAAGDFGEAGRPIPPGAWLISAEVDDFDQPADLLAGVGLARLCGSAPDDDPMAVLRSFHRMTREGRAEGCRHMRRFQLVVEAFFAASPGA